MATTILWIKEQPVPLINLYFFAKISFHIYFILQFKNSIFFLFLHKVLRIYPDGISILTTFLKTRLGFHLYTPVR